jgi:hypothetical protein
MNNTVHPAAASALPFFITPPGKTDVLMVAMGIILVLFAITVGVLYFKLHALPDHLAHKKVQLEIVCVLGLIAMFTHMHIFWIAGLLLALIDLPDFSTPLKRIAGSTEKIASSKSGQGNSTILLSMALTAPRGAQSSNPVVDNKDRASGATHGESSYS